MSSSRYAKIRWFAIALGLIVVFSALYVGWHALQEDVSLSPDSPLRWVLVDARLRGLDLGPCLEVEGYYYTVGDGPKLPGSEVRLAGNITNHEAMNRAKDWLRDLGFEATKLCWRQECHFSGPGESAVVTVGRDEGRTHVNVFIGSPERRAG